ncbi:MAG: 60S ribosomal protein L22 [Candidatus Thorarchaeota archaeon]
MSKASPESELEKTFITIEVNNLIRHSGELGDALVNFLTEKLPKDIKISLAENEIYVRSEKFNHPSKTQLRVYLKRFLHLNALRDDLKIISQGKDRFVIIEYITVVYVEE